MNTWTFTISWKVAAFLLWFSTFTPSERVALTAAFLVLIGVAGEYVIEVPAIEKRIRLKTRIKRLSMALLLLGLTGDVLGIVMGQAEMVALTKEAGDAAASAKKAREEANSIGITASQARTWVLHLKPRYANMDRKKFVETLNGVPPEKVEILYERENEEAYTFASAIALALGPGNGNAGWNVSDPRPVIEQDALPHLYAHPKNVPLIMRAGGQGGCGIIAKSIPSALREALANTGVLTLINGYEEPKLPDGRVRIVIGKQWN